MVKKVLTIFLLIALLSVCFCGCGLFDAYKIYSIGLQNDFVVDSYDLPITGMTLNELTERYGEPDLINEIPADQYSSLSEPEPVRSICYNNNKRKLIGNEPTEYYYIGFDAETGLSSTVICPWYLPTE